MRSDDGPPRDSSDARARALGLLQRYGYNATSFQTLEPGYAYWFDGADACVAYVPVGRAWVVAGAPIAAPGALAAVTARFMAHARASGRRVGFFAVEQRFLAASGCASWLIGEQPAWDPQRWEGAVRASKSLREQLRRARAKGVTVRAASAPEVAPGSALRTSLAALVARWLGTRALAPMGFLVDVQPFGFAEERRYFVAERGGAPVAFLVAVPVYARGGWLFEDLLRGPDAPNGTAELLVDAAMRAIADAGSTYATLGLAPLAGAVAAPLRAARRLGAALYDFRGVHAFKARLRPIAWEPIYLAFPRGGSGARALIDALGAFARGSFTAFGARTLLRGPAVAVRALAALLVPWTALLATADTARWFPSRWIQRAWVLFDVLACIALFALTLRWRRALAVALAGAITADALLTVCEALAFNARRVRSVGEALVVLAACAAPALASAVLWGALRRRLD